MDTGGASTASSFDNAEDGLSSARLQTFNFAGWGDAPDVLEPLLFYVLHRASNEITDPRQLATFKMFLLDETWLFIKNETIRSYIVSAQKTWRKHNAAMILATQSLKELEESAMLQIVSNPRPKKLPTESIHAFSSSFLSRHRHLERAKMRRRPVRSISSDPRRRSREDQSTVRRSVQARRRSLSDRLLNY